MRRVSVGKVAPLVNATVAARLRGMLEPDTRQVYDDKLQPLADVWWPRPVRKVAAPTGEIAMFELQDPGELQEWR